MGGYSFYEGGKGHRELAMQKEEKRCLFRLKKAEKGDGPCWLHNRRPLPLRRAKGAREKRTEQHTQKKDRDGLLISRPCPFLF